MDKLFRVSWRWRTSKRGVVRDFQCPDLATLMRTLERSEGVRPDGVAELIIHQIQDDGSVMELFAQDDDTKTMVSNLIATAEGRKSEAENELDRLIKKGHDDNDERETSSILTRITEQILASRRNNPDAKAKPRIKLRLQEDPTTAFAGNGLYSARAAR